MGPGRGANASDNGQVTLTRWVKRKTVTVTGSVKLCQPLRSGVSKLVYALTNPDSFDKVFLIHLRLLDRHPQDVRDIPLYQSLDNTEDSNSRWAVLHGGQVYSMDFIAISRQPPLAVP